MKSLENCPMCHYLQLQRNPLLFRILRCSQKPCRPPPPAVRVSITHPEPERDPCKPPVPVRIKLVHEPEREPCTPPPPPPPPPKDDKWLWISIAAMIITGGFVVFAKWVGAAALDSPVGVGIRTNNEASIDFSNAVAVIEYQIRETILSTLVLFICIVFIRAILQ